MITKERLTEIIDNLLAWGQEHDEEFYDCLMNAANMTDEELAELDFVYRYDGEEDENLVKLQKKLKKKTKAITSPEQIIKFCKENNIDTYNACIATSCDSAFKDIADSSLSFNCFCGCCEAMWQDTPDDSYGLTAIAEQVADFYNSNGRLPEHIKELLYGASDEEDEDKKEEDF